MRHHEIGLAATLFAVTLPDIFGWAGKLLFAVVTAVVSSYVSGLVRRFMDRKGNKK